MCDYQIKPRFEQKRDWITQIGKKSPRSMSWRKLFAGPVTEYLLGCPSVSIVVSEIVSIMLLISHYVGRNPDWIALNMKFPTDVMKAAFVISLFPDRLKPWVSV